MGFELEMKLVLVSFFADDASGLIVIDMKDLFCEK